MIPMHSDEAYSPNFNHALQELQKWRVRYTNVVYPGKALINIFYRQHTVNFMWDYLYSAFEKNLFGKPKISFNDYVTARNDINNVYRQTQLQKTQPILMSLLNQGKDVGDLSHSGMTNLVNRAESRDNKAVEELEFSYLYYALANEYLFRWSASGMIGKNKQEAFIAATGIGVNTDTMSNYGNSLNLLGQLGASQFLQRNYKPLSDLF